MGYKKGHKLSEEILSKKVIRLWENEIKSMDLNKFKERIYGN